MTEGPRGRALVRHESDDALVIAPSSLVGYCVFPFMRGALLSLIALVVVGLPPAAHAMGDIASTKRSGLATDAPACAVQDQACEASVSVSGETGVDPGAELATPSEIGCALVFRNTSAVDHGAALHVAAASPADVRLWSCDESALRVFNAWYRVSRFPEAEASRAFAFRANGSLAGHISTHLIASLTNDRAPDHQAPPTSEASVALFGRAELVSPQGQDVAYQQAHRLLVERSLAPPERPPRA